MKGEDTITHILGLLHSMQYMSTESRTIAANLEVR